MKKFLIIAVAALLMASCGGDFGTVGKKFDAGKYKIIMGDEKICVFESNPQKYGYVLDGKIALPPIFDKVELPKRGGDGSVYFVVSKDEKAGVVKAFEKDYYVPCEYKKIIIHENANILVLGKSDGSHETLRLTTLEKVETNNKPVQP